MAGTLVRAVRENPWTIAGPGEPDTIAIERLGVFAKGGAEGIMIMTAPNGATVALKTLDGSGRVATAVANSSGNAGTIAPSTMTASQNAMAKMTAPASVGWLPIHSSVASIQGEFMARL